MFILFFYLEFIPLCLFYFFGGFHRWGSVLSGGVCYKCHFLCNLNSYIWNIPYDSGVLTTVRIGSGYLTRLPLVPFHIRNNTLVVSSLYFIFIVYFRLLSIFYMCLDSPDYYYTFLIFYAIFDPLLYYLLCVLQIYMYLPRGPYFMIFVIFVSRVRCYVRTQSQIFLEPYFKTRAYLLCPSIYFVWHAASLARTVVLFLCLRHIYFIFLIDGSLFYAFFFSIF